RPGQPRPAHADDDLRSSTLHPFPFLGTTRSYAACKCSPTLGPALLRRFTPRMGPRQTAIIMDSRLMCRFGAVLFVVSWVRGSAETFRAIHAWYRREGRRSDMNFSYRWVVVAIGDVEYRHGIWPAGR